MHVPDERYPRGNSHKLNEANCARDGTVPPEIILTYAFKFYTSWRNSGVAAKVSIRRSLIPRTKIFSSVNCLNPRADNLHVAVGHLFRVNIKNKFRVLCRSSVEIGKDNRTLP